jgi:hypothetical protein
MQLDDEFEPGVYDTTVNNRDEDDDELICDNCECVMKSESDLFYHDGINVCEACLDELRRMDEIEYQEWERDDFEDYE